MTTLSRAAVLAFSAVAILSQACTLASPTTVEMREKDVDGTDKAATTDGKASSSSSGGESTSAPACSAKFVKADISKLTACEGGHCYAKAKMDAAVGSMFAACPAATDVCVPDAVLTANGGKLKSCSVKAVGGKPGGCIAIDLVPLMKEQGGGALKQDVCDDPGEVCAPCQDPTHDNADTPFCQPIGVRDGECSGTATSAGATPATPAKEAASCCGAGPKSNGICMPTSSLPADQKDSAPVDTCAGDNKCVPRSLTEGKPVKCEGILGRPGICLDKCFDDMMEIAGTVGVLAQENCGETEICIPCFAMKMKAGDIGVRVASELALKAPGFPRGPTTMSLVQKLALAAAVALPLASVACTIGEETHEIVYYEAPVSPKAISCKSPFVKVDLGPLTACGSGKGKGHCYDTAKVGMDDKDGDYEDPACTEEGEACIPDKWLTSNGGKAKACTFKAGSMTGPGACGSLIAERANASKGALAQDICDADERCLPCVDPTTGKDTGVCEAAGAHEESCTFSDGGPPPDICCHGMGICSLKTAVPKDQEGAMVQQDCKDDLVCLPASLVNSKPVKCDVLGVDGVCIDRCFATQLEGLQRSIRGGCGPTELCLPCVIGKSQGMPGCE